MAKWLNKYFSLGNNNNNKTKSPPQPPRPDYKRNGGTERSFHLPQQQFTQYHHHTSPLPGHCREESDLIKAYRAQKERDFEDPYNGPGSSLRKLRAMCMEEQQAEGRRGGSRAPGCSSSTNLFQEHCPGSSTNTTSSSSSSSSSPHLYRSNSERRPTGTRKQQQLAGGSDLKYIVSPKHRLIKIDSGTGWGDTGSGTAAGGTGTGGITWSPAVASTKTEEQSNPAGKKDKLQIADDYSDPFDAKNEQKNKGIIPENNGYMEPYEAQRLMTDIQKQESQKSSPKNIQLYDTPYEPECNGVESDSESLVGMRLRESKLPQDDDRPADEYDQPWEWNKALPALAAQFNGSEKRQSSPSPSSDRRRQLRAPGGGFKPIKHGSPELCGILGERVDPNVALEKQIWYHGAISRTDAENLLRLCKECSYLVRNSQTSKHDYSLSLKSSQGFMHMKLSKTKEKYILGQNSPPFDSVPEVIHFYTTRKLPIKGAEHLSLLYPVAVRTL
ncbi:SH2 domain-containing adapter protein B [Bombina bombina]|uniref:SH2 domain-containing adapter protein B n=1 Tax=Bombina bombina TaxID=8345 RepID=UPI00235B2903|nr:SH2 domain-containing adapter protein B [Bombina bombina]